MSEPAVSFVGVSKLYRVRSPGRLQRLVDRNRSDDQDDGLDDEDDIEEEVNALSDVTFDIEQGAAVAILGPPASGKTTLLNILGRVTTPTAGHVVVRGRVSPPIEMAASFVDGELTGRENAYGIGSIFGVSRDVVDRGLPAALALAELEDKVDLPARTWSKRQLRRLGLAVALHLESDIYLADAALGQGDELLARRARTRLLEAREAGATMLFAANDAEEVRGLCDEAIWLDSGRVVDRASLSAQRSPATRARTTDEARGRTETATTTAIEAGTRDLLRQLLSGSSYAQEAAHQGVPEHQVRERAHRAVHVVVADGARLAPRLRLGITDVLLRQAHPDEATLAHLARTPEARQWARMAEFLLGGLTPQGLGTFPREPLDLEADASLWSPPLDPSAAAIADVVAMTHDATTAREAIRVAMDKTIWLGRSSVKWADVAEAAGLDHEEAKELAPRLAKLRREADLSSGAAVRNELTIGDVRALTGVGWSVTSAPSGEPLDIEVELLLPGPADDIALAVTFDAPDAEAEAVVLRRDGFSTQEAGRFVVELVLAAGALRDGRWIGGVAASATVDGRALEAQRPAALVLDAWAS